MWWLLAFFVVQLLEKPPLPLEFNSRPFIFSTNHGVCKGEGLLVNWVMQHGLKSGFGVRRVCIGAGGGRPGGGVYN